MALFEVHECTLRGVRLLTPRPFEDDRGRFVKTFHQPAWEELGIPFTPQEEFYSVSGKNVLRGMHFQVPPAAHRKVVTCLRGEVLDVLLDLRREEPTFGQSIGFKLTGEAPRILFIPVGIAHGFLSHTDGSLMFYSTDHPYAPEQDAGVRWDSFGFDWQTGETPPMLSPRDREHPEFTSFPSPF